MQKPRNFDQTEAFGSYRSLPPGGYECIVLKVEETTSRSNKPMLKISMDIATGDYQGIYSAQWKSDTRQDKKWPCVVNQLTEDSDGNCSRGLKTFIDCVAASNPHFFVDQIWGDDFCRHFKNCRVGGLFRREQYRNQKGEIKWSTKCSSFVPADGAADRPAPADKLIDEPPSYSDPWSSSGRLSEIPPDDEYPF